MSKGSFLKKHVLGFTILELMVVVFIISVLAAVAIPLLNRYLKKSKTAEVGLNLRKIYDGEIGYFQEEHTRQDGTVVSQRFIELGPQPTTPSKNKQFGNFDNAGWSAIKFAPDGSVLFSYRVISSGVGLNSAFTARANGDIDGDGKTSLFERLAIVNAVSGEVVGGSALYSLDELE